jgi:hypothetical protein
MFVSKLISFQEDMQRTRLLMQLNTLKMEKRTWNMLKLDGETELKKRSLKIDQLARENEVFKKKINVDFSGGGKENTPKRVPGRHRKEKAAVEGARTEECKQQ